MSLAYPKMFRTVMNKVTATNWMKFKVSPCCILRFVCYIKERMPNVKKNIMQLINANEAELFVLLKQSWKMTLIFERESKAIHLHEFPMFLNAKTISWNKNGNVGEP